MNVCCFSGFSCCNKIVFLWLATECVAMTYLCCEVLSFLTEQCFSWLMCLLIPKLNFWGLHLKKNLVERSGTLRQVYLKYTRGPWEILCEVLSCPRPVKGRDHLFGLVFIDDQLRFFTSVSMYLSSSVIQFFFFSFPFILHQVSLFFEVRA